MPPSAHVNQTVETDASNTHTAQRNTSIARQQQFQARMQSLNIPLNGTSHSINTVVQRVEAGGQHPVQRQEDFKYLQRTIGNQAVIQLLDRMKAAETEDIHKTAAKGVQGTGSPLPHLDKIQQSFGQHDISGVQAFTGTKAATASKAIGAQAYTTGNKIAFSSASPDLHTTAHEATHVLQQRAGVQLNGGVGEVGDSYERHADRVADAVVRGRSSSRLLGAIGKPESKGSPRARTKIQETKPKKESSPNSGARRSRDGYPVQRIISLDGVNLAAPPGGLTVQETAIEANWISDKLSHAFISNPGGITAQNKLTGALVRAVASAAATPALFRRNNLLFRTQAAGRDQTLYFVNAGNTGRMRPQHGSGPLQQLDPLGKTHYFFTIENDRDTFATYVRNNAGAVVPIPGTHNYHAVPRDGDFHYEMALNGGTATSRHSSGGTVITGAGFWNSDAKIAARYSRIIGLARERSLTQFIADLF